MEPKRTKAEATKELPILGGVRLFIGLKTALIRSLGKEADKSSLYKVL